MDIPIVFEDESFIIIDKPSGVTVNRSENAKNTVADWAEEKLKIKSEKLKVETEDFYNRSGIVHRLDKATSGLLLIAKNPQAYINLQTQFADRQVEKKYYVLVHGLIPIPEGKINMPVGRLPWNRTKFGVISGGRNAVTNFKVINYYTLKLSKFTFLDVKPETGRTHQIRIHLKAYGFSVVGDKLYAGGKVYEDDLKFCKRLFLQAYYLSFKHPVTNKNININIDLTGDLNEVIKKFQKIN